MCDSSRDIRWNKAWALGKCHGFCPLDFLRVHAIFHSISLLSSQYRYSLSSRHLICYILAAIYSLDWSQEALSPCSVIPVRLRNRLSVLWPCNLNMTYLSWTPPNMNSIGEVCNSLCTDKLTLFVKNCRVTLGEVNLGEGRDYKRSFVCLYSVEM